MASAAISPFGRPASEGPFTFVYYYPQAHRDTANRLPAWEQVANVTKDGVELVVIRTRGAYNGPIGDPSDPNTIRIVEAG